jgi:DNA polymerase
MLLAPPTPIRTIIAGSRTITDYETVKAAMASCPWRPTAVLSGAARGVDELGERWAVWQGMLPERYPAQWDALGPRAGLIRNELMAANADALVAIWDGHSAGTRHMIETARARGLRVHVVQPGQVVPTPASTALPPPPPVAIHQLPLGTVLNVGPATATVNAECDMETFSAAGYVWDAEAGKWVGPPGAPATKKGLEVVGLDNYARHPSAEVLMMAYDLKDGRGWRLWIQGAPFPDDLRAHLAAGRVIEAHNAGFEQRMWEHVGVARYGWPAVRPEQWRCSAAKARAYALPGALGKVGAVLQLDIQKDKAGEALIKKFCMPRNPTKTDPRTRILCLWSADLAAARAAYDARGIPHALTQAQVDQDHADTLAFARYCVRDIETEAEVSGRCPDLEGTELAWWQFGQRANARGVHVNREALENAAEVVRQCLARYNAQLLQLTGIDAASKVQQLLKWLASRGVHADGLDEESVDALLARTDLPADARRVLEIRAAAGSASVKKVHAMLNAVSPDSRLRDLYIVNGARTGRDTGVGPQPANLPSAGPAPYRCACGTQFATWMACPSCRAPLPPDTKPGEWNTGAVRQALATLATRSLDEVERVWGPGKALPVIAGCLRAMYDAAPGHELISSDYNSIEAVAMAMVSGEQWRIDTFRTHGKIYEASASAMFNIPFEEMMAHRGYSPEQLLLPEWWTLKPANKGSHHPLRKTGKIAELAFGFQGWLGSAKAFGMPGTDEEIKDNILRWRRASPSIEWLWGGQTAGKANGIRRNGDRWSKEPFYFGVEGAFLQAALSEGVEFRITRLDGTDTGFSYTRHGNVIWAKLPSGRHLKYHNPLVTAGQRAGEMSLSYEGWNTNPKNGPVGWIRMDTWGGRLVENLIQACCRDILTPAVLRLEAHGYPVVMRTYDEIVSEVPVGYGSHEEFERLVEEREAWYKDWPVRAPDSWRNPFYQKAA